LSFLKILSVRNAPYNWYDRLGSGLLPEATHTSSGPVLMFPSRRLKMCHVTVHIAPAMENVTVLREAIHVNVTDSILEMFASTKRSV
jgi:hypothetical protein